jgi:5-methyltetrahydrofolate--homocysteine methyltransferase
MGNADFAQLQDAIYSGDSDKSLSITESILAEGMDAKTILNDGLIKGMEKVGVDFKNGDLFLPEVLLAARAMKASMTVLKPLLIKSGVKSSGKVILGTVKGDIHDIGKNLVGMMLEGSGFEIIDLGNDVEPEIFIDMAIKENCRVIGMSAMLTTTMMMMKETIIKMKDRGIYDKVKVMVGGAPVTPQFAEEIGAFYSANASEAVDLAKKLFSMQAN